MRTTTNCISGIIKCGMMLMVVAAMLISTASCNKDDGNGDGDIYVPSPSLSESEIVALINNASAMLNAEANMVRTEAIVTRGSNGSISRNTVEQYSVDVAGKKELDIEYDRLQSPAALSSFRYVDGISSYFYHIENISSDLRKEFEKVTDAYFTNVSGNVSEGAIDNPEDYDWTVAGNDLVGVQHSSYATEKYTVTLYKNMKYRTISGSRTDGEDASVRTQELVFEYGIANPSMPSGFGASDFTAVDQFSVKVVWGQGKGENIFYSYYVQEGTGFLNTYDVSRYAPVVAGYVPEYYYDAEFTQPAPYTISLTDNNTVIYVKWVASAN